jgi:hypothetical protein
MPIYKTFMVLFPSKDKKEVRLRAKTIDITQVESWQWAGETWVKVFMKSGDKFMAKHRIEDFGDIIYSNADAYGTLFTFNSN